MPLLLLLLLATSMQAQKRNKDLWQSWAEVMEASAKTNKPILVDVYTDWCRYCRLMEATTYRNDSVSAYLRKHYLRFKLDAEGKDTLRWSGKTFTYDARYKVHEFAFYLAGGRLAYPSTVIITPAGQPFSQPGYLKPSEMEMLLKYFVERTNTQSIQHFAQNFRSTWK